MNMHNPPHPGEFIDEVYLKPFGRSSRFGVEKLGAAPSTINRVIKKQSSVSPEMALRLSKAIGRSLESWLAMQESYDLWQARQTVDLDQIQKVEFAIYIQLRFKTGVCFLW